MHFVVVALLIASSPVDTAQPESAPRALGPALGAFIGGAAGATICVAATAAIEPSENAPFAMLLACSVLVPTTLIGTAAGANLSDSDNDPALIGAGAGLLAGLVGGAGIASAMIHATRLQPDRASSVAAGIGALSGATIGATIGAGLATME